MIRLPSVNGIRTMLDALVSITRFNRGEANKIFEEVESAGVKIVVKNNVPVCVMVSPEQYKKMADMIDDDYLLNLALSREANGSDKTYSFEEVLGMSGHTLADVDAMEDVELE